MKLFTLGAVALLIAGATIFVPAGHAANIGAACDDNKTLGQNTIFAAGFAFGINWTPACITVDNGATVTWQTADAEPVHGPLFIGTHFDEDLEKVVNNDAPCWASPAALQVPNADRDVVRLAWNPATQKLDVFAASTRAAAAATGGSSTKIASCSASDAGVVVDSDAHVATLSYQCILHKAAMTGQIKIKF